METRSTPSYFLTRLFFVGLSSLLFSQEASVSGASMASHTSKYFQIFIEGGIIRNFALTPPDKDGNTPEGLYHREKEKIFKKWIERSLLELDAVFNKEVEKREIPIAEFRQGCDFFWGSVIEDRPQKTGDPAAEKSGAQWFAKNRKPVYVKIDVPRFAGRLESASVLIVVNGQVRASSLERLGEQIQKILEKHAPEEG